MFGREVRVPERMAIRKLARYGLRGDLEDSLSPRHGPEGDFLGVCWVKGISQQESGGLRARSNFRAPIIFPNAARGPPLV